MSGAASAPARKLPAIEPDTGYFWICGAEGVLRIQRCGGCGHWQHPPLPRCPKCHSAQMSPQPVSGRARLTSFTLNRQEWLPGMTQPFIFAVVELVEQPELYVFTNLLCAAEEARIGMDVVVTFEHQEDVWLPLFRPASPATKGGANG